MSGALLLGALVIGLIGLLARLRGRRPTPAAGIAWPAAEAPDRVVWAVAVGAALVLLGPPRCDRAGRGRGVRSLARSGWPAPPAG